MKIIIPVAGAGTRLRPHTYTQPKSLIPLAGKTIISFIIDDFLQAGQNDFIFIIGYLGEKIKNFIQSTYPDINAQFITQEERQGTGHALYLCKNYIADDDEIFIVYGDTICDFKLSEIIASDKNLIGLKRVDDPRSFGVAEMNENAKITKVVEKPKIPLSNLAMVGLYKIKDAKHFFNIIENDIKENVELTNYPLTTALQALIQSGTDVYGFQVEQWHDCGRKETLLETNAILLDKMEYVSEEIPFFENSIIIHPVSLGKGCEINDSIIGPNVSIAADTVIKSSLIKNSIIGQFSEIKNVILDNSLIGSDAVVIGKSQGLNIGDNTEIDLR